MLDDHFIVEVRLPSSASVALPVKAIGAPTSKTEPLAGVKMVIVGRASISSVIDALPVWPSRSVVCAVMTCVPRLRIADTLGPVPRVPSRLDDHWRLVVMSPSSKSKAMPEKVETEPNVTTV